MSPPPRDFNPNYWLKELGNRLLLAKVTGHEFAVDEDGITRVDENGNPLPTGNLQVQLLDRAGSYTAIPQLLPMAGNSAFAGGYPEIGSLCIVGFRENTTGVIIGFLPMSFPDLNLIRGEVPNLQPGEYMIQGSDSYFGSPVNDTPELGPADIPAPQYFSGARVLWDKYARLVIQARDCECVYGPVLAHEYTPNIAFLKDPITGHPIIFRQKFLGGKVESRVDQDGNAVMYCAKDLHLIVEGNLDLQVKNIDLGGITKSGFSDQQGNKIKIEEESEANAELGIRAGDVVLKSVRGDARVVGGANVVLHAGGNIEEVALRSKTETVTDVLTRTVGNELQETVGLNKKEYVGGQRQEIVLGSSGESVTGSKSVNVTGSYEEIVAGQRKITVAGTMTITAATITLKAASVKVEAAQIELGTAAIEKIVKQTALALKFNTHEHPTVMSGPPDQQLLDSDFGNTVKVGL